MTFTEKALEIIKSIPYGKVTTYGTVAVLAGSPRSARQVGFILHGMTEKYVLPWQRVINREGFISIRGEEINAKNLQKSLLEQEGVEVSSEYMVDLDKYGWWGENTEGSTSTALSE